VDNDDIDTLITYWGSNNNYELGPCANGLCNKDDLPNLTPAFDGIWNIEDLMTFALMWDWSSLERVSSVSQVDRIGIEPGFKFEDNNLYLAYPETNNSVYHMWFQIDIGYKRINFEIADFSEDMDLILNRSSEEGTREEWSLISLDGNIDVSSILLGTFNLESKESQDFKLQYKLTGKNSIISSGSIDLIFSPIPDEFELSQAYPNPFNPRTTIEYALPVEAEILLSIYDMQGRLVTYLAQGLESAGYHKAIWDGSQYASGMYFIRMNVYGLDNKLQFNKLQKIMLVK